MEEGKKKALSSFQQIATTHWFRYMDDTWVKIKVQEIIVFTNHINTVYPDIKFTREDTKKNRLWFYEVLIGSCGNLEIEIYRKS